MKRQFAIGLLGAFVGALMVFVLIIIAGAAGAQGRSDGPARTTSNTLAATTTLSNTFTYQGQLKNGSKPLNDTCQMTFSLWDSQTGGGQIGSNQLIPSVSITNSLFTVQLNNGSQFGSNAFNGNDRWLEIIVQCSNDSNPMTLTRQALTFAPQAIYAITAGIATTATTALNTWSLNGNNGTISSNFLGTLGPQPLIFKTGNLERMRIDSSGNVGVGTNAPGSQLAVSGTIQALTGGFKFPDNSLQTTAASKIVVFQTFFTSGDLTNTEKTIGVYTLTLGTPAMLLVEYGGDYTLAMCATGIGANLTLYRDNSYTSGTHISLATNTYLTDCSSDNSTTYEPVQLSLSAGQHVFKLTGSSTLTTTAIGGDFAQFNSSWLKITQE